MFLLVSVGHQYPTSDRVHQRTENKPRCGDYQRRSSQQGMTQTSTHLHSVCFQGGAQAVFHFQLMEHTMAGIEDLCGQWSHFYWKDK